MGRMRRGRTQVPQHKKKTVNRKYTFEPFNVQPHCFATAGYGDPTGAATDINKLQTPNLNAEYYLQGTQTLLAPTLAADGLLASLDLTNNDGVEYNWNGSLLANGKHAYTAQTDKAFFMRMTIKVADISGLDTFLFGFRKNAAYAAAFLGYGDFFGFTIDAADGNIDIGHNLNAGTPAFVDTGANWADGESKTFEVIVKQSGLAVAKLDEDGGTDLGFPTNTKPDFTFDSGDVLIPVTGLIHAATSPGAIHFKDLEIGFKPDGPDYAPAV